MGLSCAREHRIVSAMRIIASPAALQRDALKWRAAGRRIGLVPTMGALHEGHLALIRRARRECAIVVVSIYVNPTQFGPKEDLARYPRPRRADLAACRAAGADVVFAPANLYLPDHSTFVEEGAVSQGRDGASRPGHFRGVATVVLKLFNLALPDRAYFGQKDAQQVDVIRRMARDLDVPVRMVVCPTVRAADGVALSSRNVYLSPDERLRAAMFARALQEAARKGKRAAAALTRTLRALPGVKLDYVEAASGRLCAAVWIGKTRLIDNERVRGGR
jgi:pantoate--beta-alanine ligase